MKTLSFFRLPIISFIVTFCSLLILLILKLNHDSLTMYYAYSPDFMRILGSSLYTLLIVAICFNHIKLYTVNMRNVIFVVIIVALSLLFSALLDRNLVDLFAVSLDFTQQEEYQVFFFWYPILSRFLAMLVIFLIVVIVSYCAKNYLKWQDETCRIITTDSAAVNRIQISYFIIFYLAVNLIFQRYLYVAFYLYSGGNHLSEFHNFSFYLASGMTAILLLMFIQQQNDTHHIIKTPKILKIAGWILLSQLLISIVISFITIYAIQWFFIWTQPSSDANRYSHYINLLYTMINSVFIVSILTCLATYLAGRFWLKRLLFAQ